MIFLACYFVMNGVHVRFEPEMLDLSSVGASQDLYLDSRCLIFTIVYLFFVS